MQTFFITWPRHAALPVLTAACVSVFASLASADVPKLITYQGRVAVAGTNFTGTGSFQFALLDGDGVTRWSNDGNNPPTAMVTLAVTHGQFDVRLGDTAKMSALPTALFATYPELHLRVWFNDGSHGLQQLAPDQRMTSAGYALMANDITDGAVTSAKIVTGAVGTVAVADNSLTATDLAANSVGSSE